jgi:hypothetical protein
MSCLEFLHLSIFFSAMVRTRLASDRFRFAAFTRFSDSVFGAFLRRCFLRDLSSSEVSERWAFQMFDKPW